MLVGTFMPEQPEQSAGPCVAAGFAIADDEYVAIRGGPGYVLSGWKDYFALD